MESTEDRGIVLANDEHAVGKVCIPSLEDKGHRMHLEVVYVFVLVAMGQRFGERLFPAD